MRPQMPIRPVTTTNRNNEVTAHLRILRLPPFDNRQRTEVRRAGTSPSNLYLGDDPGRAEADEHSGR